MSDPGRRDRREQEQEKDLGGVSPTAVEAVSCLVPPPELPHVAHTPGPWRRSGLDANVIGATRIIRARGTDTDIPQMQAVCRVMERLNETDANAHLIAAAPDLLDALRGMVGLHDNGTPYDSATTIAAARATLAKAEGRQVGSGNQASSPENSDSPRRSEAQKRRISSLA